VRIRKMASAGVNQITIASDRATIDEFNRHVIRQLMRLRQRRPVKPVGPNRVKLQRVIPHNLALAFVLHLRKFEQLLDSRDAMRLEKQ
jgi:hypothetical protein